MHEKVKIFKYITENTFDAYSWQIIENKLKFINQIMTSRSPVRSCEDIDENILSAAEAKAQATGNPLIKEKIELDNEVNKLRLLKGNFENERYRMQDNLRKYLPKELVEITETIHLLKNDQAYLSDIVLPDGEQFKIVVEGVTYTDKKTGGTELFYAAVRNKKELAFTEIGEYAGFKIFSKADDLFDTFHLKLKRESSHLIEMGNDPIGVITRVRNALQKIPDKIESCETRKHEIEREMEQIKLQLEKPFEKAEALSEKEKRLKDLTEMLNQLNVGDKNVFELEKSNSLKI